MITIKTPEDIENLKISGKHLAEVLSYAAAHVKAGVSTDTLNDLAEQKIEELGGRAAFLGYKPDWARMKYPASLCVSVNDVVVHGIPNVNPIILQEGDTVGLDAGYVHEGMFTDSALTVIVGEGDGKTKALVEATKEALKRAIAAARAGNTTGDIGHAVESFVKPLGYGLVRELAGHGVGYEVHEEPTIPNYGKPGKGEKLEVGMVIALEPMLNMGTGDVDFHDDDFTVTTADGEKSAHFEHTLVITDGDPVVVTRREGE
jgi:methionyl aminopeptidase